MSNTSQPTENTVDLEFLLPLGENEDVQEFNIDLTSLDFIFSSPDSQHQASVPHEADSQHLDPSFDAWDIEAPGDGCSSRTPDPSSPWATSLSNPPRVQSPTQLLLQSVIQQPQSFHIRFHAFEIRRQETNL
ncbi:hypothetical protein F4859DRAFT_510619 [Xylaria cf. heliscus]|nr:hypothetical protein F4859DRAFT_510619 [Xylaria cf. heliscus]